MRWSFTDRDMKAIGRYAQAHGLVPQLSVAAEGEVRFRRKDGGEVTVQLSKLHDWWATEKAIKKEVKK